MKPVIPKVKLIQVSCWTTFSKMAKNGEEALPQRLTYSTFEISEVCSLPVLNTSLLAFSLLSFPGWFVWQAAACSCVLTNQSVCTGKILFVEMISKSAHRVQCHLQHNFHRAFTNKTLSPNKIQRHLWSIPGTEANRLSHHEEIRLLVGLVDNQSTESALSDG